MNVTSDVALGAIDNADVLLASVTVASFALFLPASRDGEGPLMGTAVGRFAFFSSLAALLLTSVLAAFSTRLSFWALIGSMALVLTLGTLAVVDNAKVEKEETRTDSFIQKGRGRPPAHGRGPAPPSKDRCVGFKANGERCRNGRQEGPWCAKHQGQPTP